MNEMIKNMMEDEAIRAELLNTKTPEELSEALKAHGVEISAAELESAILQMTQESDELSETDLNEVAGGFWGAVAAIAIMAWLGIGYVQGVKDGMTCRKPK